MATSKIPKALKGGTSYALDKHRRIVREMPAHVEKRMMDITARNESLNAQEAYNARLERDRLLVREVEVQHVELRRRHRVDDVLDECAALRGVRVVEPAKAQLLQPSERLRADLGV